MRVAIVITGLEVGGAETFLAEMLRFRPDDIEVRVFSLIDGGLIAERIKDLGVEVTGMHMLAGRPSFYALFSLMSQLRRYRPAIVHTWMYHADLMGGVAAKMAGVRHVIWHLHNSDLSPKRVRRMTRFVVKTLATLSHWIPETIVSCSEAAVRTHTALGYDAEKFIVIPNGVDADRFKPSQGAREAIRNEFGISQDAALIGLVARVDAQKNHRGFFEAVRLFFERGGDADFLLTGREVTPDHWQLGPWRDDTGHPERITLAGPRKDVPSVMASIDVATSSSLGEAFPLVLVEAMACGTPCVATDVGDSALIVSDTGMIVPPDDADALAAAWLRMLSIPAEERALLGKRGRERVLAKYAIEDIANRVWGLYRAVTETGSS